MKKCLLLVILALGLTSIITAEEVKKPEIYDGSLEKWIKQQAYTEIGASPATYEDLDTIVKFWTSLNFVNGLPPSMSNGPLTCFKETGRTGGFAARLVSKTMNFNQTAGEEPLPLFLPGAFGNMTIDFPNTTAIFGVPFVGRPDSLVGYMKYFPVNKDSARVFIRVQKTDDGMTIRRESQLTFNETVSEWTRFAIPISYTFDGYMDTITILCAASAGYNFVDLFQCKGQEGSTLWIDDLALVYPNVSTKPVNVRVEAKVFPNPADHDLIIETPKEFRNATLRVFDMMGRQILTQKISSTQERINVSQLNNGMYTFSVNAENGTVATGKFNIGH